MSGNSSGEKTEQPTPKKLRDARKKGQVARSTEIVTTTSLFAVIAFIWVNWHNTMGTLLGLFDKIAQLSVGEFRVNAAKAIEIIVYDITRIMLPVLGVVFLAGILANYFQIGTLFSAEAVKPNLDKISPGKGFKRIFSMKQLVETLKSIIKIAILSILLYFVVKNALGAYISSLSCGMSCLVGVTSQFMFQTFVYSALAFVVVAVVDIVYQRRSHIKTLMMSKDEVKREFKESEGDPHIKGKRRQIAQELAMNGGGAAAREGTAVVVNPTHFAVVILYTPEKMPLPIVTAKGRNRHAHFLRTQAEEAGVPVFRNVQLAQALYADAEVDDYVPTELFDAVAEVLAWVARNRNTLYKGRLDHGVLDMEAGDHRADVTRRRAATEQADTAPRR
ncbi:type III secretion system export apparatus subunit SctU [Pseudochelatococcus lubricantis]|uniref:type III secretion system export apparatus subunit SctU n=1 Tax=Pseudochelatococcus lubricantis TaxID=1538102 RepID=UPI0035ED0543